MKFLFVLCFLCILIFLFPHLRIFIKRIILGIRIKKLCRRRGYTFLPAHSFPFLGQNNGKRYDFSIETETEVLCVKLFAAKHKHAVLKFHDRNRLYSFQNSLWLFGRWGTALCMPLDTKLRSLPDTDFFDVYTPTAAHKRQISILLIHPRCHEIHGSSEDGSKRILAVGDTVYRMRLESGKTFLEYLSE